jgi:methylmalonyl-CoA mutase, N-terminal domain
MTDLDKGERALVGVTDFKNDSSPFAIDGFVGTSNNWENAMERLKILRRERHAAATTKALRDLAQTCRSERNIMPAMMNAVDADATLGDFGTVFREAFGDWHSPIRV